MNKLPLPSSILARLTAPGLLVGLVLGAPPDLTANERPLRTSDVFSIKDVDDPQLSPDGRFVAYSVRTLDGKKDKSDRDVYMAPVAGGEPLRLTSSPKSESTPRFSPDGEWIAFLSSREGSHGQVFLLSRRGGEAVKLTDYKASVSDLAWSPDSKRLALVVSDVDPDAPATDDDDADSSAPKKTAKPIVLKRLQFKRDGTGYLNDQRSHVHVFEVASKKSFQLTSGPFDDEDPAWSPDGERIAFVSNRSLPDADASDNSDVFVVGAREGEVPRGIATGPGDDASPVWSPDGQWVAYVAGGDPKDMWYGASHLALAPSKGGASKPLTAALDRNVLAPRFSPDGRSLLFVIEDGGNQHFARVPVEGGAVERVVGGEREVQAFSVAKDGTIVVLESSPHQPPEISVVEGGSLRRVTRVNDEFLKGIRLGTVERFKAKSKDGTPVDGFLTLPPGHAKGQKLPAILRIHGGPASQYSTAFELEWQMLAAYGYAVVAANPRGSTGYGTAFSRAIFADWGNKDFDDVMAAVDHVVAAGTADPDRLGVGGWSYGGIMTNYVIAKTGRFKAAVAGSGAANYLANYGIDHYQHEYEVELGLPWKARELWVSLSSPFFDVEKITTPTLFMCGALDVNVPLLNSEQQYQALRRVGKVATELVIYPDQWHSIRTPSYQKDRLERYLAWYDRFLRPGVVTAARTGAPESETKPEATSLLGRAALRARARTRAKEGARRRPGEGHGRVREEPGLGRCRGVARAPLCLSGPLSRRDRRLHERARAAPERRAAAAAPGPPLHLGARARQGAGRPRARRGSREGPQGRARAGLRSQGARNDHAAVRGLLPPGARPLPERRFRGRREGLPALPRARARQRRQRGLRKRLALHDAAAPRPRGGRRTRARADQPEPEGHGEPRLPQPLADVQGRARARGPASAPAATASGARPTATPSATSTS